MNDESERTATPGEAKRKGLEHLKDHPHHVTTEETHRGASDAPPVIEPPGEKHRGGPLPNQKR